MPQKIIAKVSNSEVQKIKKELQILMKSATGISISPMRFGSLGDEDVISFNVDDDHFNLIFEKMKELGTNLLMPIVKKTDQRKVNFETGVQTISEVSNTKAPAVMEKQSPEQILETAIKYGDYETIIKISKDIRNRPELIRKAKDKIYDTVIKEIEKVYELGKKSSLLKNECIERLIKISSDKDIKAMYRIDALKSAGLMAVNLCASSIDYTNYLIQLCNNNAIPNIVNIKAAIVLSVLLFPDEAQSTEELDYVVKYLNINWLLIAYDVVIGELSMEEKDKFIQLINAVKERR